MPGITAARRRPFNTRGRIGRTPRRKTEAALPDEPPSKRRRYVPGGPGGGGRYVDADGTEIPVGGTGPGGFNYVGPRSRIASQNLPNGVVPVMFERPEPLEPPEPPEHSAPPERPRRESRRDRTLTRPRYSSAAAAAAAVVQGDGFKPREERGWEEFHQDLDIEVKFPLFSADEVDGIAKTQPAGKPADDENGSLLDGANGGETSGPSGLGDVDGLLTPMAARRRPGRPPRRPDSMLKGIGTPATPKVVPLPGPNPREKLTLPKPSFRLVDPFTHYEQNAAGQLNYVDRSMASVGYQESDIYIRPEKKLIRLMEGTLEEELDIGPVAKVDGEANAAIGAVGVGRVEYDMDEQDQKWLEAYNAQRKTEQVEPIKPAIFEITMTKIEKEWHALEKRIPKPNPKPPQTHRPRSSSAVAVNGEPAGQGEEQDSKCAICDDGDCENTNAIVFCDGCDLAVHQECYGVPFIPEGQWLCRRCQLIGRGTPTCIFCPNTDGAFKQTNASRWAHLLCAVWIPEVSLGNATFMEPVMDVEKVPKQRWKLTCYICRQAMGACIQCGNKNCYSAFHVTCARRARLFLQMKTNHGGSLPLFDPSILKAFCDKHAPSEWRKENDTENAITDAVEFYRYAMRGRKWADSQQAALDMAAAQTQETVVPSVEEPLPRINLVIGANKRKRMQSSKLWRLPSGAPIIPATVYDSVEGSLQRFTVRKRREFAADICKYWTLKREAKRGAALIKRLQLQMETFSSMEVTRRDFAAMGTAGRTRLHRRIEFVDTLLEDLGNVRTLVRMVKEREEMKLQDAYLLKDLIHTVYLPIPPLLSPILEKALALDGKSIFRPGLEKLRERNDQWFYTSVSSFSADLGTVFSTVIGMSAVADTSEVHSQIVGDKGRKDLNAEQKEKRKLAKRIIKAVQPALEDAMHKESELERRPYEKELQDLDTIFERSLSSGPDSVSSPNGIGGTAAAAAAAAHSPPTDGNQQAAGSNDEQPSHQALVPVLGIQNADQDPAAKAEENPKTHEPQTTAVDGESALKPDPSPHRHTPDSVTVPADDASTMVPIRTVPTNGLAHPPPATATTPTATATATLPPPTPPLSSGGEFQPPLPHGGIPWYMEPFDPDGTTVFEERWTGREVARGMSEELSDMDDEELSGLVDGRFDMDLDDAIAVPPPPPPPSQGPTTPAGSVAAANAANAAAVARKKNGKLKKRWRGFR